MPYHIQYDAVTGEIQATVFGTFTPVIRDARKQVIFDKEIDVSGKVVDVAKVVDGKVNDASKDAATILKADPNIASADVGAQIDPP